jgi:hypothetical protein
MFIEHSICTQFLPDKIQLDFPVTLTRTVIFFELIQSCRTHFLNLNLHGVLIHFRRTNG